MGNVEQLRAQRIVARLRTVASDLSGYDANDLVETSTFLDLGFDSLFLTQLAAAFQGEYGLKITFRQLFDELPTLRALAEHIDRQLPPESVSVALPASASASHSTATSQDFGPGCGPAGIMAGGSLQSTWFPAGRGNRRWWHASRFADRPRATSPGCRAPG